MQHNLLIISLLTMMVLVGCSLAPDNTTDTLDLDNIQTILPTVDPSAVVTYAQLADDDTLVTGQNVYEANCATCHGIDGEGQFPDAPMQPDGTGRIGAPPHNGNGHTWHHDDDLLYEIIRNGGMGTPERFYPMPAFGEQLPEEEIVAVLAYIKTFWTEEQRLIQAERTLLAREQN